jgi:hypothetical protein
VRGVPKIPRPESDSDSPGSLAADSPSPSDRSERIRFCLPLLLLAGASLVCSYILYHDSFAPHATHVPLWVLAFSVGVISSIGGSAAYLVGDFSGDDWVAEARASPEFVVLERGRWAEIQAELARASVGRRSASVSVDDLELPEWSELPSRGEPGASETPTELIGSPAPMSVTRGIDSLATEVDRLVADLESAAQGPSAPTPRVPTASLPPPRPRPTANANPPPTAGPSQRPAKSLLPGPAVGAGRPSRATRGTPPTSRPSPQRPSRAPTPAPRPTERQTTDDAVSAEYRTLLAELEARAAKEVLPRPVAEPARPELLPSDVRCVGCDAKLGRVDRTNSCRSCRSPMCDSCRGRSAKEGYPGLCAVCSILEETKPRDGSGNP